MTSGEAGPSTQQAPAPTSEPADDAAVQHEATPIPTRSAAPLPPLIPGQRYIHEPNVSIPSALMATTPTPAADTIFGVRVDFEANMDQGLWRQLLTKTRHVKGPARPHITIKESMQAPTPYLPNPELQPDQQVDYKYDFMGPYAEGVYRMMPAPVKNTAHAIADHYSKEDSNHQRMVDHNSLQIRLSEQECQRLQQEVMGFESKAQDAQDKKNEAVQTMLTAIQTSRDACLMAEASDQRLAEARVQMTEARDKLLVRRREEFKAAEDRQDKRARTFTDFEFMTGAPAAAKLVEGGMVAVSPSIQPPARPWNRE